MAGGSYVGITQYLAAEQQPPHLAAITPAVAISDLYREGYTHGGVPNLFFDPQYIAVQGAPGAAGANNDPSLLAATLRRSRAVAVGDDRVRLSRASERRPLLSRPLSHLHAHDIEVPALIIGGWRDGLLRGAPEMYRRARPAQGRRDAPLHRPVHTQGMRSAVRPAHRPPGRARPGALVFEFLQKHLRGSAPPERPRVEYYVQGRDEYARAATWPPRRTRFERVRLGAGRWRSATAPGDAEYVTNPAAGFSMAFDRFGTVAASPYVPTDQRLEGPQGLTFRTRGSSAPLPLAGPLALRLVPSSTATDTDWHAKLADVAPDGSESIITDGALRASHRALDRKRSTRTRPYHTHTDPQPIEPGRFYDYDDRDLAHRVRARARHRLQLRLTSSDLPTHLPGSIAFDRNRPGGNTGQPVLSCHQHSEIGRELPAHAGRTGPLSHLLQLRDGDSLPPSSRLCRQGRR